LEKIVKEKYTDTQSQFLRCKKKLEALKIVCGKPKSSLLAVDIELTLRQYCISSAAHHSGDFNGVCCHQLVEHATGSYK
jgi:hypothetical protein